MPLSLADIDRIARLARLHPAPTERECLHKQLDAFFGLVETIQSVDTTGVTPLAHPMDVGLEVPLRLHEDRVGEPPSLDMRALLQRNAPSVEEGLFLVPKVLD
ncbi:Asp-tRNA(Asn)/Glu-tRNA(Gln) amidotransferase subunit GatC [Candidatus Symbiobacter mobilis]|nr:Asp-tRNA(Asn)/Glu-tRNA(Gln) amidotransferase subunit GatC [Candidatus Symbiobacter mobilis]